LNGPPTHSSLPIRGAYLYIMQRLLAPAILYLNSLNLRQKFLLVGLVWFVPLAALTAASLAKGAESTIIVIAVIGGANALYLTTAFYESTANIASRLKWVSHRLVSNSPVEPIKIDSQDELGQVASAVNDVAQTLGALNSANSSFR